MRNRWMYYATGLPGWMRFGFSPGWIGRSPTGLGPCATYLLTGTWPFPMGGWPGVMSPALGWPAWGGYGGGWGGWGGYAPPMAFAPGFAGMGWWGRPFGAAGVGAAGDPRVFAKTQLDAIQSQLDLIRQQLAQASQQE